MRADTVEVANQFQCVLHSDSSMQARSVLDFQDEDEFKYQTEQHLNWRNKDPTPANRMLQNGHSEVLFYTINTARVDPLCRVCDLVRWLSIHLNRDPSVISGEYLILNEVLSSSIVYTRQCYRGYWDDQDSDEKISLRTLVLYDGHSLHARAPPAFHNEDKFKDAIELHLNWSNREPTPFVSSFENQTHAVNFANVLLQKGRSNIWLYQIDTIYLGPVFRVRDLVDQLRIRPMIRESTYWDEYLILSGIPKQSDVANTPRPRRDHRTAQQIELEQVAALVSLLRRCNLNIRPEFIPDYGEPYDDYGDDEFIPEEECVCYSDDDFIWDEPCEDYTDDDYFPDELNDGYDENGFVPEFEGLYD
ncbi:hypothetical protein FI667_g4969, partial [Globisporangium splendens]